MNICKIKEVCQVNPPKKIPLSQDTDISFVPMSAVSTDGKVDLSEVITVEKVKSLSVFKDGDVIFAKITPCMENGKGAVVSNLKNGYGAGSTEFTVLRPNETHISEKWLYYYLSQKHFRWTCQQNMTGSAGQKRVPAKYLAECLIPVPPLEEQQRIVARIEELFSELDAAVATLERTKEQLAVYRQAVLKEAFTKDNSWESCSLGDVIRVLTDYHSNGSYKVLKENVTLLDEPSYAIMVRSTNFEKDDFKTDLKYINQHSYYFLKKSQLFGGEVLMGKIGNAGKVYYMKSLGRPMSLAMNMFAMRFNEGIYSKFVYYYLLSSEAIADIKQYVKGVGTPTIDKKSVRSLKFVYPNENRQMEIVDMIESRLSVCDKIEETVNTALQEAEAMRQSILKQAFAGEL